MRCILLLTSFLLLTAPAHSLAAQSAPRPAVGARVRLMTPTLTQTPHLFGRITAVDSTGVTIHTDKGEDTRLPTAFITQIAVSSGITRRRVSLERGTFAGLLIGALAGRLAVPEHRDNGRPTGLQFAVRGGLIGAVAGAIFGAVNRPERWDTVALRGGTLISPQP